MSLNDLAKSSFSSVYDESLPPSALELRHVLLDPEAVDQFNHTFPHDSTYVPQFQYLEYIAQNITRTEWELDRHQEEERLTYERVMANDDLRDAFQPIDNVRVQKGFIPTPINLSRQTPLPQRHPPSLKKANLLHDLRDLLDHRKRANQPLPPYRALIPTRAGCPSSGLFLTKNDRKKR